MKKLQLLIFVFVFLGLSLATESALAAPSFTASESVANVTAGTNNQAATTTATQANVVEVKASRTLTVGSLPGNNASTTIGTCVVTFASSTGATNDELNCADNAAAIDRDTGAGNTARTATDIAVVLRTLTSVSDTGHGALTVTGTTTTAVFTTTGTETSATAVTFADGTTAVITSTASTTGVVPVAQINTISISGTVDTSDVFTATLPTVGAVSYTVTSSDTTTAHIANGLRTAIVNSSGYASQAFTAATSSSNVVLTAKVAGTGFTQTSSTSNRAAVAQTVTFTPLDVGGRYRYAITLNGTEYADVLSDSTVKGIVEGLNPLLASVSGITCTENDILITCVANSAGTAFTYSAVAEASSGGGGGGSSSPKIIVTPVATSPAPVPAPVPAPAPDMASLISQLRNLVAQLQALGVAVPPSVFVYLGGEPTMSLPSATLSNSSDLDVGARGAVVINLQKFLIAQIKGPKAKALADFGATGIFGPLTKAALAEFQASAGIMPAVGYFGPKTKSYLKSLGY